MTIISVPFYERQICMCLTWVLIFENVIGYDLTFSLLSVIINAIMRLKLLR